MPHPERAQAMIVVLPDMVSRPDRERHHAPEVFGSDIVSYSTTYTDRDAGMPQVILVEVPEPGHVLRPHYHASDQFQLVLEGSGRLGTHALGPVSLHYTNKYTGYGPIVAGPQGLSYYVLRPAFDPLGYGQYLHHDDKREAARRHPGRKRSFIADFQRSLPDDLESRQGASLRRLFGVDEPEPDAGLLADLALLGPGVQIASPDPDTGGGQVIFVVAGSIEYAGDALRAPGAIVLTSDATPVAIRAGQDGAQVLLMQYPRWQSAGTA